MGSVDSDGEGETIGSPSITKRSGLPKKFSVDLAPVAYASIPRKLRSAIKKRSYGSQSSCLPISKKLNHMANGDEMFRNDGLKKLKLSMTHGVSGGPGRQVLVGPITKDEEEVAETLYSLAGMFPETAKLDGEPSIEESAACADLESSESAVKGLKDETGTKTISSVRTEVPNQSSDVEGSAEDVKIQSSNDDSWPESLTKNSPKELHAEDSEYDIPSTALKRDGELTRKNKGPGLVVPHLESSRATKDSGRGLGLAAFSRDQHELLYVARENKHDAPWAGSSFTESRDPEVQRPPLRSSNTKFPDILNPPNFENSVSSEKQGAQIQVASKKSWKRCCTHVRISHLVTVLKESDKTDTQKLRSPQSIRVEGLSRGALVTLNSLTESTKSSNGIVPTSNVVCSAADRNSDEIRNAVLLHKWLLQDQQQASTTSQLYTLQKQNLDFSSLPTGAARAETSVGISKVDLGVGIGTGIHSPYLQSKKHPPAPFLLQQNYFAASTYIDRQGAAVAQQVQLPPYHGSTGYAPSPIGYSASSKRQSWQQQSWSDQVRAQCKPDRAVESNMPIWQNGRQDSSSLLQFAQSFFPPHQSSLEVLGPSYAPRQQQQQQQLINMSPPLPPSTVQGQQHHMLYSYQGSGGGHHAETVPPLQLLCNKPL